ncbi:hypothetical protein TNIN_298101 [Trichonephila inaurata madagascariensis]|uniref:Uncharacterized protein n=1 Tax=Trichonephila inaurata madagascariensis TaxID=2747483 RepID=A0A8X7BPT7_9ARAC|nr:hypothetical protein TNIN_298101 [Trichonephila inaurata madagascariensis]
MIANNLSYLYEDRKKGGCAMPEVWKDVDFYLVDTAFKLFTSKEEDVATRAVRQIQHTGGAICFVSHLHCGTISDKERFLRSKPIDHLEPNSVVIAYCEFLIEEELDKIGCKLKIPLFFK